MGLFRGREFESEFAKELLREGARKKGRDELGELARVLGKTYAVVLR